MSYDSDILLWSEQQADLLRRMARGERVNGLDWENVAEEIESVGRSELHAVESQLRVALTHLLLMALAPWPEPVRHWRAEATAALAEAARGYVPSMAQRIRLDRVWRDARRVAERKLEGEAVVFGPELNEVPFALAELVVEEPSLDALLARLSA